MSAPAQYPYDVAAVVKAVTDQNAQTIADLTAQLAVAVGVGQRTQTLYAGMSDANMVLQNQLTESQGNLARANTQIQTLQAQIAALTSAPSNSPGPATSI
jgi:hypothetical protein